MRRWMGRGTVGLVVMCVLAAGSLLGSTSVLASGGVCTVGDGCAGNVTFASKGAVFTVHDYDADGWSVVGYLDVASGDWWSEHTVWNRNGYSGSAEVRHYSVSNGTKVRYQVCLGHHSTGATKDCSAWQYDTA